MSEDTKTDIQELLLEATAALNTAVTSSLNNIFGSDYEVVSEAEIVTRLKTDLPHVIVMGFANDDYQGMLILSFGNISLLEEFELTDSDLIQDPFGETANQTVGIFNDHFSKFGHIEQAPPMYSNANSTSFPLATGILNRMVKPGSDSDDIIFGFSIKPAFKVKQLAKPDTDDSFVGIDLSDVA